MKTNKEGIALIKLMEGYSERPYICPAGKLTVGYGHTGGITGVVSKEKAEILLKEDLSVAEAIVADYVNYELNSNQFSALVSFVYNVGGGNFRKSTLLKYINADRFDRAAEEFSKWTFAGGEKLQGLVKRRILEKQLFEKEV